MTDIIDGVTKSQDTILNKMFGELYAEVKKISQKLSNVEKKKEKEEKKTPSDKKEDSFFKKMSNTISSPFVAVKDWAKNMAENSVILKTIGTTFKGVGAKFQEGLSSMGAIITEPLKELFGIDLGAVFSSITDSIKNKKKSKTKPKVTDVASIGPMGAGFLWLGNLFQKLFPSPDKEVDMEAFKGKLGLGNIGGILAKALPIAGIIASLGWAIMDGIKGLNMAEAWGVNKVEGFIGSFLGGTGSGWMNAFKNAGKWALMGVSAGFLIGGPIGALVGGLIGAVIGGLLGFFGGEKIAQATKAVKDWAIGLWDKTVAGFKAMGQWFQNSFFKIFGKKDKEGKVIQKGLIQKMKELLINMGIAIKDFFIRVFDKIKNFVSQTAEIARTVFNTAKDSVSQFFMKIVTKVSGFLDNHPVISEIVDKLLTVPRFITNFFMKAFEELKLFMKDPKTWITEIWGRIWNAITGFFDNFLAFFRDLKEKPLETIKGLFEPKDDDGGPLDFLSKIFKNEESVDDAIITKDGRLIRTSPDDNIIATKVDPELGSSSSINLAPLTELQQTIDMLAQRIGELEPQIINSQIIQKGFTSDPTLKEF
jgi:hypothetical protein